VTNQSGYNETSSHAQPIRYFRCRVLFDVVDEPGTGGKQGQNKPDAQIPESAQGGQVVPGLLDLSQDGGHSRRQIQHGFA
jgi:hypothetical protein